MKFYRNDYSDSDGQFCRSEWFGSKAEANKVWVARHRSGEAIDGPFSVRALTVEIDTRKTGLVRAFNDYASCDRSDPE